MKVCCEGSDIIRSVFSPSLSLSRSARCDQASAGGGWFGGVSSGGGGSDGGQRQGGGRGSAQDGLRPHGPSAVGRYRTKTMVALKLPFNSLRYMQGTCLK